MASPFRPKYGGPAVPYVLVMDVGTVGIEGWDAGDGRQ